MTNIASTKDGTTEVPQLKPYLHLGTLSQPPSFSASPPGAPGDIASTLASHGYVGVQEAAPEAYRASGLSLAMLGRANTPDEIEELARRWAEANYDCGTLHIGWGYEDDHEIDALVRAVADASDTYARPLYIETHRATITQDPWRTLRLIERNPGVRFNGDFSHWYTGTEMPYGDFMDKVGRLGAVFERVRFIHARVGDSSNMQVPSKAPSMETAMEHFRELRRRSFSGFLRHAERGDYLIFAPELLPQSLNYPRCVETTEGEWTEDSDRWEEALKLVAVAKDCWDKALRDSSFGGGALE